MKTSELGFLRKIGLTAVLVLICQLAEAQIVPPSNPSSNAQRERSTERTATDTEAEVMRLERVLSEALVQGNTIALEEVWAAAYVYIMPNGMASSRQKELLNLRSGTSRVEQFEIREAQVRTYGAAALVIGQVQIKEISGKHKSEGVQTFADTWINFQGKWKLVMRQMTPIVP